VWSCRHSTLRQVAYVKTLADTAAYSPGEMSPMLPLRTKTASPEDEIVWNSRWTEQSGEDEFRNVIVCEKSIGASRQAIAEIIHENQGPESEIAEVEIPLSDQDYDYRAHLRLLRDFADGSFFKGW